MASWPINVRVRARARVCVSSRPSRSRKWNVYCIQASAEHLVSVFMMESAQQRKCAEVLEDPCRFTSSTSTTRSLSNSTLTHRMAQPLQQLRLACVAFGHPQCIEARLCSWEPRAAPVNLLQAEWPYVPRVLHEVSEASRWSTSRAGAGARAGPVRAPRWTCYAQLLSQGGAASAV